jgi:hypothetical protein
MVCQVLSCWPYRVSRVSCLLTRVDVDRLQAMQVAEPPNCCYRWSDQL